MQAVVLAGGLGTRLRPLTTTIPKQLLPIAGAPMIVRVLEQLAAHGVDRAVLSMGHLPEPFAEAFPDRRIGGVDVSFAIEPEALGTAGAIRFAARTVGIDTTFLAVNGDVLTDLDISSLVSTHRASGAEGTIALSPVDDPSAYGVVVTDSSGCVSAFVEKPPPGTAPSHNINAGTYVLEPSFADRVTPGVAVSIEREVFPRMVEDRALFARVDSGYWLDAGTPAAYLQANTDVLDGVRSLWYPGELTSSTLRLADATVAPSASVARSVLGAGVAIGEGARVEGSVVLDGAQIGPDSTVADSIVGPGAIVGRGASLSANCLVAGGVRIPDGACLERERVAS